MQLTAKQGLAGFLAVVALLGLTACADETVQTKDTEYIEQSRSTVVMLQQQLSTQLKSSIQAEGVVAAIQVCANVAQPMTGEVSSLTDQQTVSRTALRVRNPANQPDALFESILRDWQTAMSVDGDVPEPVVSHQEGQIIVYHPIILQKDCLICHGDPDKIAPDVFGKIESLYPSDTATGFAVGDLRGAFRVVFEAE
jgi:hypothetical protein